MGEYENFLNKYADLFRSLGQGETSGRILALLMVGDEPKLTLDELSDILGRSKSTVHSAVKKLLELEIIRYDIDDDVPSEGRYQHLYQINHNFWEARLKKMDALITFKTLLFDSASHLKDKNPSDQRIDTLIELAHMYEWFEERLPLLYDEWAKIREEKFGR